MITVKVSRWFRGRFSSRFIFDRVFDYVFERDSEYSTAAIFCQKLSFALVWTSGVTCLISKVAFQCPQLAVRKLNQKNAATVSKLKTVRSQNGSQNESPETTSKLSLRSSVMGSASRWPSARRQGNKSAGSERQTGSSPCSYPDFSFEPEIQLVSRHAFMHHVGLGHPDALPSMP